MHLFLWVIQALAVIIGTIIIVRILTTKVIPWFVKKYYPEKFEDFKKKYLDRPEPK